MSLIDSWINLLHLFFVHVTFDALYLLGHVVFCFAFHCEHSVS